MILDGCGDNLQFLCTLFMSVNESSITSWYLEPCRYFTTWKHWYKWTSLRIDRTCFMIFMIVRVFKGYLSSTNVLCQALVIKSDCHEKTPNLSVEKWSCLTYPFWEMIVVIWQGCSQFVVLWLCHEQSSSLLLSWGVYVVMVCATSRYLPLAIH